jgi:hypothetical protein
MNQARNGTKTVKRGQRRLEGYSDEYKEKLSLIIVCGEGLQGVRLFARIAG